MNLLENINWVFNSSETLGEIYNVPSESTFNFYIEHPKNGKLIKKFLPSIGQKDQEPPFNKIHKDDPQTFTNIRLNKILYFPQFYSNFSFIFDQDSLDFIISQTGLGLRISVQGIKNVKVFFENNGKVKKFSTPFNIFLRVFENGSIEYEHSYQKSEDADFDFSPEAFSVLWNLSLDSNKTPFVPVSKGWVKFISEIHKVPPTGSLIFNWDQAFASIIVAKHFPELGQYLVEQLTDLIDEKGFSPQLIVNSFSSQISNPPILFLTVAYNYLINKNIDFLKICFPKLLNILNWWETNRKVTWNDHLYTWGGSTAFEAGLESGWDNSPLWERMTFDEKAGRFSFACPMATGFILLANRILEILSSPKILNKTEEYNRLREKRKQIINAIEENMWSKELEAYLPVDENGCHLGTIFPGIYYPGFTGEINPERFKKSLKHLNDQNVLGGDFLIPTLSRSDPDFNGDGDYWRGRIWPPVNFLTTAAIANYSKIEANKILESSKSIFKKNFSNGISGENYSSVSGNLFAQPGVYSRNCPVYVWGGLLALNPISIFNLLHINTK